MTGVVTNVAVPRGSAAFSAAKAGCKLSAVSSSVFDSVRKNSHALDGAKSVCRHFSSSSFACSVRGGSGQGPGCQSPTHDRLLQRPRAAANANRPAAAEFQRVLEEWKTVLKDLRKLKVQYQSAALADQANIQQKWKDLVDKGNEKVAALEAAGLKAYAEAPNEDPQAHAVSGQAGRRCAFSATIMPPPSESPTC